MAQSGMARLSSKAKSRIYANLEKYARSGMGMEKACLSLLDQPRLSRTEKQIYEGILTGIRQGKSIGDALGESSRAISPLEHEVVSASEEGGKLDKGFSHLSSYFTRIDRTRRKILKGLAYPLILIHLAVPVSTLAVTVFSGFRMDGSAAPVNLRDAFLQSGQTMLLVYLLLALFLVGFVFLLKAARTSAGIDGILSLLPLLGKARRSVAMERFSQVFEIFLLSGKKMSDSLHGAARASGSGLLLQAGTKGAAIVAAGDSLATAIYASPRAFPRDFSRGLAAAEESGQLDHELAEWGRFYSDSAAEAMDQLAEWTPKLFYWAILLLVAGLIIRAALAYTGMIQNLIDS